MANAAFGIVRKNDRILLMKIAEPFRDAHKWNFPGGVIENGESIPEGLEREILEETNIVASVSNLVDNFHTIDPENSIYIYEAVFNSGSIKAQEFEAEDAQWFTIEQALQLSLAFNIRDYIKELR